MNAKAWIAAVTVAVSLASLGFKANATLIDLGERDLASRLNGVAAAQAYIETSEGLPLGTLTYLNSFDGDTNLFANDGALTLHFAPVANTAPEVFKIVDGRDKTFMTLGYKAAADSFKEKAKQSQKAAQPKCD